MAPEGSVASATSSASSTGRNGGAQPHGEGGSWVAGWRSHGSGPPPRSPSAALSTAAVTGAWLAFSHLVPGRRLAPLLSAALPGGASGPPLRESAVLGGGEALSELTEVLVAHGVGESRKDFLFFLLDVMTDLTDHGGDEAVDPGGAGV